MPDSKPKPKSPTKTKPPAGDWRTETLARMRGLILEAVPGMVEERKWKKPSNGMVGVPVWSRGGLVCTAETYAKVVKLTFAKGAGLPDPSGLFNSSLDGNTRRAIDIREGEPIDAAAFRALVRAAVALNEPRAKTAKPVKLLSGGNPQIAKADGDAPVRAYIAAMPGWKSDLGRRLDELIVRHAPGVRKAVKWNTPFYGIEGRGWFLAFHTYTHYVQVAFFEGTSLEPMPPVASKTEGTRYANIREGQFDEAQMAKWVTQAVALPGVVPWS